MNSDYDKKALINTDDESWVKTDFEGISKKILALKDNEETSLIKLEKNSILNNTSQINSVEILVLEGTYSNEFGDFPEGTYLRFEKEDEVLVKAKENCVIFRKTNHFSNSQNININTKTTSWLLGQGNLEVMPLAEQTALVKWPKNERFLPHKHWGGEEIFVLNGIFMDEYGEYPKNTWIRSPHLSEHYPFVNEETIIFVKTGHI